MTFFFFEIVKTGGEREINSGHLFFELFRLAENGVGVRKAGTQRAVRSEVQKKSKAHTEINRLILDSCVVMFIEKKNASTTLKSMVLTLVG